MVQKERPVPFKKYYYREHIIISCSLMNNKRNRVIDSDHELVLNNLYMSLHIVTESTLLFHYYRPTQKCIHAAFRAIQHTWVKAENYCWKM